MKGMRYRIFDTETNKYLKRATQVGGDPRVIFTEWTRNPERAQGYPGMKSARAMRDKLGGKLTIHNTRGREVQ